MIIVGALISLLVTGAQEHAFAASEREKEAGTLYALSRTLPLLRMPLQSLRQLPGISTKSFIGKVSFFFLMKTTSPFTRREAGLT
jgi:K+-sensing histidine kinase KdpD